MCTKAGFSLVPVPGYLPNSNDLEQKNADQIIQTEYDEVNLICKEMQVIMQGDNKHPHINKSGSFSQLRSFELKDMGFSLNKISLITFNIENPQTSTSYKPPFNNPKPHLSSSLLLLLLGPFCSWSLCFHRLWIWERSIPFPGIPPLM